jgi:hypothetical protein
MSRPWRHDGYGAEVDDDQLTALRRLRAAFGFVEVVEVIGHDSHDDPIGPPGEPIEGEVVADPGRMTREEREQAHTLLTRALTDPDWRTASQALDDLLRKLLVVHRLLEAEERLAIANHRPSRRNGRGAQSSTWVTGPRVRAVSRSAAGAARTRLQAARRL